jgi:hypothetical protein
MNMFLGSRAEYYYWLNIDNATYLYKNQTMKEKMRTTEGADRPPREPLDKEWFTEFKPVGSFDAFTFLEGNEAKREAERKRFEAGDVDNPTLDYNKLDPKEFKRREDILLRLKKGVLEKEASTFTFPKGMEAAKRLYRWKINEKVAELRMLQHMAKLNSLQNGAVASNDNDERKMLNKRISRYSQFVYGNPSPDIFHYTVHTLKERAGGHINNHENEELANAAKDLLGALPQNLPVPEIYSLPDEETFKQATERTLEELGDIIQLPDGDGDIDPQGIRDVFAAAIKARGALGWEAVLDENVAYMSTDQENKKMRAPLNRPPISRPELSGLTLHEFGTHVLRRLTGERSVLMLFGLGFDRYERGEEGVATFRQQIGEGRIDDFAAADRHLAISLAKGLDGTPRDFRGVYEIIRKFYLFKELESGKDAATAEKNAKAQAWITCVRVFHGTDCKTPGVAFTKDIVYREGNIDIWGLVGKNPDEMTKFSIGKFDPTNKRHLVALAQLGITDDDLAALEEN